MPATVMFELWTGASDAVRNPAELRRIEERVTAYETVGFGKEDARSAASLQGALTRSGKALGTIDALIAGMALARSEGLGTGDEALLRIGHGAPVRGYPRAR